MSNVRQASVRWTGAMRFEGGAPHGPTIVVDADGTEAPGPMVQFLVAAATCSGADVVSMLGKMRVTLSRLDIEATGVRNEDHPRRYRSLHFVFHIAGSGLDENKARRAIDLSLSTYCSVLNSLNPDIPVTYDLHLG